MPTWAIRFDLKRHKDPGPRPFVGTHNAHDGHFMKCSTLSSKGGPDVLSVRGVYADRVARRTNCMPSLFKNNIGQLLREALEVIHPDKQSKDTWTPDFTEKFSTTLMAGMNYIGQPAGPQEADDFLIFMKYMSRHRKSPPPAPYAEMDQYEKNQQQVLRAFHAIAVACSKRRFFVTTDGRFGIGPGGLADDDLIVVLYGGTTPFALRRVAKERYRYVGACYVLGMMGGEVMRKHKAERSRDYVFHIE
ncbi:hypothetical protein PRZ48_005653 [Zasmidium cellare]|uniref:Uncharacterized protein n=1 Tax=Zasmidium cellare TaxID=395010 RepID=A0ABR0EM72_ZASCE|nr:hypothetical protein PRZ48_005653 [Zasmidium cellare]